MIECETDFHLLRIPSFPRKRFHLEAFGAQRQYEHWIRLIKRRLTRMPIYVQYEIKRLRKYKGEDVFRLSAFGLSLRTTLTNETQT